MEKRCSNPAVLQMCCQDQQDQHPGELVRNRGFGSHPRLLNQKLRGWGTAICVFCKSSWRSWSVPQFENPCSGRGDTGQNLQALGTWFVSIRRVWAGRSLLQILPGPLWSHSSLLCHWQWMLQTPEQQHSTCPGVWASGRTIPSAADVTSL